MGEDIKKNIFVSHYHEDSVYIEKMKGLLSKNGMIMRDSSIYEDKNPNNAKSEGYIKSLLAPQMNWAGTLVVLIGPETSKSDWVNWEIQYAAKKDKRIVGVYLRGEGEADRPELFDVYADALVKWNGNSIIDAINGVNSWDGSERNLGKVSRVTC